MRVVLFRSSFAHESAPNISHATKPDGSATWCGRRGWVTNEEDYDPERGVDCIACTNAMAKANGDSRRIKAVYIERKDP